MLQATALVRMTTKKPIVKTVTTFGADTDNVKPNIATLKLEDSMKWHWWYSQ